jgi:hypothetical protein
MLAFLAGVLLKVYDDFVDDVPVLTNGYVVTSLRTLQIAVTALVLAGDFWIALVFALFNGLCAFSSWEEYSRPHVVSYWPLGALCLGLSWPHRPSFGAIDGAILTTLLGVAVFEPKAFPEETSWQKGVYRLLGGWYVLTLAIGFRQIGSSMRSILWLFGGYALASSVAQMLRLCYPDTYHVEQGVDENVHAPTRRPPRRVSDEDLPELRETMKPKGTPDGKGREEPDREDAREEVNERPVRDVES